MLQYIFNKVLILSLCSSTVFIAFMAVFRIFGRILSARLRYYLLIIPMLLCLIPVEIGAYPLYMHPVAQLVQSSQDGLQRAEVISEQTNEKKTENVLQTQPDIKRGQKKTKPPILNTYSVGRYLNMAKNILSYVWISGVVLLLLYRLFIALKFKKSLKLIEAEPDEKMQGVFQCMNANKKIRLKCFNGVSTPFIFGIFRPVIFIPLMQLSEYELCMILKHELTHIRKHDLIIKALSNLVNIVHFFNPIGYLLRKSVASYCELSCDEAVAKTMDIGQCKDYGRMLLTMIKKRNDFMQSAVCLSEGEKIIKKRLEIIIRGNKKGRLSAAISIVLALILVSGSIICAVAIGSLDNSVSPKTSYRGVMDYIGIYENDQYLSSDIKNDTTPYIKNGTASYSSVAGHITFEAGYQGMPKAYMDKVENLTRQNRFDEAQTIFDSAASYTDHYQLILDKKVRSYGDGYGLEGLFTLKKNNETVFKRQTGYLNDLPPSTAITSQIRKTELFIKYTDNGKSYTYQADFNLDSPKDEQLTKNRKLFAKMDRSRQTHKVLLGDIEEVIDNGVEVDVKDLNSKLLSRKEPWNNHIATIEYNTDMQLAQAVVPIGYGKFLSIWQGEKVRCDSDSIKGSFKVMYDHIEDLVPMTMSGLNNPVGGYVEIKSDDGKYYAKYKIVPDIAKPLSVKGTKEVSDYLVKGENVFVGSPREQDDFDRDEHSVLYKRIITDDYGKVIAVVPIEWQQGKNISIASRYGYKIDFTWQELFDFTGKTVDKNGKTVKKKFALQDPGSWSIKAVIPIENQFFTEIEKQR